MVILLGFMGWDEIFLLYEECVDLLKLVDYLCMEYSFV